jgi:hypothetical protein
MGIDHAAGTPKPVRSYAYIGMFVRTLARNHTDILNASLSMVFMKKLLAMDICVCNEY